MVITCRSEIIRIERRLSRGPQLENSIHFEDWAVNVQKYDMAIVIHT